MIFVTVGTQKPFPRLTGAMWTWARAHPGTEVVMQVGDEELAGVDNLTVHPTVTSSQFNDYLTRADVVIAHAGIGTILSAREAGIPVVIMPRRSSLHEHRNDHQLDTVHALCDRAGIWVAMDEGDLDDQIAAARSAMMDDSAEAALESNGVRMIHDYVLKFIETSNSVGR